MQDESRSLQCTTKTRLHAKNQQTPLQFLVHLLMTNLNHRNGALKYAPSHMQKISKLLVEAG